MTCIIAYKVKDQVILAGDKLGSNGHTKFVFQTPKVFKVESFYFGYTTSFRFGQILEHCWKPPIRKEGTSDYTHMVAEVVPSILRIMEINDHTAGQAIIVYNNEIYALETDQSVLLVPDVAAVGCGHDMAEAIYRFEQPTKNHKEFLRKLFKAVSTISVGVSEEHDIIFCENLALGPLG